MKAPYILIALGVTSLIVSGVIALNQKTEKDAVIAIVLGGLGFGAVLAGPMLIVVNEKYQ